MTINHRGRIVWRLGLIAGLAVLQLIPVPVPGRSYSALMDLVHAPAFAALAYVMFRLSTQKPPWGDRRKPSIWAATVWLLAVGLGCCTEVLQHFTGRDPSVHDAVANGLGATAGLAWAFYRSIDEEKLPSGPIRPAAILGRPRISRWILPVVGAIPIVAASAMPLVTLADVCLAHWQMPLLASFEHRTEISRWKTRNATVRRVSHHTTHGTWSMQVDFGISKYPGAALAWAPSDWSDYKEVVIDLYADDADPEQLHIKIEDEWHNWEFEDRFNRIVPIEHGWNEIRIALDEVAKAPQDRPMEMDKITRLSFFFKRPARQQTVYFDDIRLE